MYKNPAKEVYQYFQETRQAHPQQRDHTSRIQGIPKIVYAEKWCHKCCYDPVMSNKTPIPVHNLG